MRIQAKIVNDVLKIPGRLAVLPLFINVIIIAGNCTACITMAVMNPSFLWNTTISITQRFAIDDTTPVREEIGISTPKNGKVPCALAIPGMESDADK
jgi:hypothetical protein